MIKGDPAYSETILMLSTRPSESAMLCRIASQVGFLCRSCESMQEFCRGAADASAGAGVITQETLAGVNAQELIGALQRQPKWSDFPLIVVARPGAASRSPAAVRRAMGSLGNAAVLERPLRVAMLTNVLEMALRTRRQQYARRDAEERARLARRLELERDRLERAETAGHIGAFEWYIDEARGEWSSALEELYGYAPGRFNIDKFWAAVYPEDLPGLKEALASLSDQTPDLEREFRIRRTDGALRWILVRGKVVADGSHRFAGVDIDVTERKLAEEALRDAQKWESVATLAAGIAHDFNNLLATILGNASLALEAVHEPEYVEPLLRRIADASESAAGLTRQLLAYAGKGAFVVQRVNLSKLISRRDALIRSVLPRTVELRFELAGDLPPIEGDPSQLEQLLLNLVINAGEAIGPDAPGAVEVKTVAENGGVCLEVADNGPGMDENVKARIFDPFFSTKFAGRGLGLAAVSGIVRSFNGTVRVDTAPGAGTRFHVCLPARPAAPRVSANELQPPEQLAGSGLVLVAEDEAPVLEVTQAGLKRYGYSVVTARDGMEALAVFGKHAPETRAVVLDLSMPRMNGEQVLMELHRRNPDLPVLISTGHSDIPSKELTRVHSKLDFIQKPYTPRQLAIKLKELI